MSYFDVRPSNYRGIVSTGLDLFIFAPGDDSDEVLYFMRLQLLDFHPLCVYVCECVVLIVCGNDFSDLIFV